MSLVALTVGFYSIQWSRAQFLGKTPEQIVAMGRTKWFDAYTKKYGQSTAGMSQAEYKYGEALANLNDRAIKRLAPKRAAWLKSVRKETLEFSSKSHGIGESITGGGTMWRTIDASVPADIEELIADSISKKTMPDVMMKSYEMLVKDLDSSIAEFKRASYAQEEQIEEVDKSRKYLDSQWKKLEVLISKGSVHDQTRFRIYLNRKLEVATAKDMMGL